MYRITFKGYEPDQIKAHETFDWRYDLKKKKFLLINKYGIVEKRFDLSKVAVMIIRNLEKHGG